MAKTKPYVIKQGDHMLALAHRFGFDADAVWGDASNADLKSRRTDMNILLPGDVLQIPALPEKRVPIATGATNRVVATVPEVAVHLVLRAADGTPAGAKTCWIHGVGDVQEQATDASGLLTFHAAVHIREVLVVVDGWEAPLRLLIGDLDPANEESGLGQRLQSLGHVEQVDASIEQHLSPEYLKERDERAVRDALARFQDHSGIPVTGTTDDATERALRRAYGS